ncbi:hypothetical protein PAMP_022859 [Pampus punctatissimus]
MMVMFHMLGSLVSTTPSSCHGDPYVELLQGFDVPTIGNPGFTTVEEDGDAHSLVDTDCNVEM